MWSEKPTTTAAGFPGRMASAEETRQISSKEAKLYDRQIRLWGARSQSCISSSSVLVYGGSGLAAEIVKNVVLAGVRALTWIIKDDCPVKPGNFFAVNSHLSLSDIASRVAALNPFVDVTVHDTEDESALHSFTIVVDCSGDRKHINAYSELCRENGTHFCCGASYGLFGEWWNDFGSSFSFLPDERRDSKSTAQASLQTLAFPRLSSSYDGDVISQQTCAPGLCVMSALSDCSFTLSKDMIPALVATYGTEFLKRMSRGRDAAIDAETFWNDVVEHVTQWGDEMSPVCAIVGGIAVQEILKAITGQGEPLKNAFSYDGLVTHAGLVDYVEKK